MNEVKVDKIAVYDLHEEFKDAMIKKYHSQFSEDEVIDIFDLPETFLSWCIRNRKVTLVNEGGN